MTTTERIRAAHTALADALAAVEALSRACNGEPWTLERAAIYSIAVDTVAAVRVAEQRIGYLAATAQQWAKKNPQA